jgi:hypothetical protein
VTGIVPDTKDWTWVLARPCPECGFDAGAVQPADLAARTRGYATAWHDVLGRDDVARRPEPSVWSVLEYACHVRDVYRIFDQRIRLMLEQHDPQFANWDQDAAAVADRYNEQDPARVATELESAGSVLAQRFEGVTGQEWRRSGRRSNGSVFTVESLGRYFLHDVVHHLHDVGQPT